MGALAASDLAPTSPDVQAALASFAGADGPAIHRAELALAGLVVDWAPPGSAQHLALAQRFLDGEKLQTELAEAKQECWTYVGSLACGCSLADSASAHVLLVCLEASPDAHHLGALTEQVERVLRCGVPVAQVLTALQPPSKRASD